MPTTLKPIVDKDSYSEPIQQKIDYLLYLTIYKPVIDFLKSEMNIEIKNANASALVEALQAGTIIYSNGYFTGKFASKTSRELVALGAVFVKSKFAYKLDLSKTPMEVQSASAFGAARHDSLKKKAVELVKEVEKSNLMTTYKHDFRPELDHVFHDLGIQFNKTTAEKIEIAPDFSEGIREKLIEKYNTNANLSIKKVQNEAVIRLREKVTQNMTEGFRADKLEKMIMNEMGMTQKRARFISLQETSLLVSKYREERYTSAGVTKYVWSTSGDSRVRDDHRDLNGKIFSFDNPPIADRKTGTKANPGEFFRCRCVARALLD